MSGMEEREWGIASEALTGVGDGEPSVKKVGMRTKG